MKKILQAKEKILRQKAKELTLSEITTPKIKKILREMSQALRSQADGVALAAPQIGYPLRIFIVSGKIFEKDFIDKNGRVAPPPEKKSKQKDQVFINPQIIKLSRQKDWLPEGCLSVRPLYGKTHRAKKATLVAYDAGARKFTRGASGLLAQIFQHETDHLDGILFTDHAKDIYEEKPEKT